MSWAGDETPSDHLERNVVKKVIVAAETFDTVLADSDLTASQLGFLSIDVEGSEMRVLGGLTVSKWRPKFVCVEHNYDQGRKLEIVQFFGDEYKEVFQEVSGCDVWLADRKYLSNDNN